MTRVVVVDKGFLSVHRPVSGSASWLSPSPALPAAAHHGRAPGDAYRVCRLGPVIQQLSHSLRIICGFLYETSMEMAIFSAAVLSVRSLKSWYATPIFCRSLASLKPLAGGSGFSTYFDQTIAGRFHTAKKFQQGCLAGPAHADYQTFRRSLWRWRHLLRRRHPEDKSLRL